MTTEILEALEQQEQMEKKLKETRDLEEKVKNWADELDRPIQLEDKCIRKERNWQCYKNLLSDGCIFNSTDFQSMIDKANDELFGIEYMKKYGEAEKMKKERMIEERRKGLRARRKEKRGKAWNKGLTVKDDKGVKGGWTNEGSSIATSRRHAEGRMHGKHQKSWFCSFKNDITIYCASSYELRRTIQLELDDKVVSFQRCFAVPIYSNGKGHRYTPDFIVEYADGSVVIEEITAGWEIGWKYKEEFSKYRKIMQMIDILESQGIRFEVLTEEDLERKDKEIGNDP